MPAFTDSLRGYALAVLRRDNFVCRYCALDGKVWPNWLYLSWGHLLPIGHLERDNPDFIVAACTFCNTLHNRTVFEVSGKSPEELVEQKKVRVLERRDEYQRFWKENVAPRNEPGEVQNVAPPR